MEKQALLSLVVKLVYPFSSLTEEEQFTHRTLVQYLYFYGSCDDYDQRMKKVWRPGAIAELIVFKHDKKMKIVAAKERGVWKKYL